MNKHRKYRVKSRIRFVSMILIALLVAASGFNWFLGLDQANGETVQNYVTVEVSYGDTLWDLAETHMGDQVDLREAVHQIIMINDIEASQLKPGQVIKIPV